MEQYQEYEPQPPQPNKPKSRRARRGIGMVVAGAIIGSVIGGGGVGLYMNSIQSDTDAISASQQAYIDQAVSEATESLTGDVQTLSSDETASLEDTVYKEVNLVTTDYSTTVQNVTEDVSASVVGIATSEGTGTGLIVSNDGLILTNEHVIAVSGTTQMFRPNFDMHTETDTTITVTLVDGTEYEAEVLFSDEDMDLAVIKINADGLTAATLGNSDDVSIGEITIAIGNPLGLEQTVTSGIISALDVSAAISNTQIAEKLIQTDAAINSGNSGGPLLNASSEVIGITSYKLSDGEGIGFAIPINAAIPIINQILDTGAFQQAQLGVAMIDSELLSYYDYGLELETGVYVYEVDTTSDAYAQGLQKGDIIIAVDGTAVDTILELKEQIYQHIPGDSVTLTVQRNGNDIELTVVLGSAD